MYAVDRSEVKPLSALCVESLGRHWHICGCKMTYSMKVSRRGSTATVGALAKGASILSLDQRMVLSRRFSKTGSLAKDWDNVGKDLSRAVDQLRQEIKAV